MMPWSSLAVMTPNRAILSSKVVLLTVKNSYSALEVSAQSRFVRQNMHWARRIGGSHFRDNNGFASATE